MYQRIYPPCEYLMFHMRSNTGGFFLNTRYIVVRKWNLCPVWWKFSRKMSLSDSYQLNSYLNEKVRRSFEIFAMLFKSLESTESLETSYNLWNLSRISWILLEFLISPTFAGIFKIILESLESHWNLWNIVRISGISPES